MFAKHATAIIQSMAKVAVSKSLSMFEQFPRILIHQNQHDALMTLWLKPGAPSLVD